MHKSRTGQSVFEVEEGFFSHKKIMLDALSSAASQHTPFASSMQANLVELLIAN